MERDDEPRSNPSHEVMASTSPTKASTPAFHADDPEETTEYRTLSVLAIISLVFGIASPLALTGSFLLVIPLFGVAISLLALRNIAVSEGTLAGRWAALAGLLLCIASIVAPFSRDAFQRMIRSHQAEKVARNWLSLLTSGEGQEAFRQTLEGARPRPASPEPGAASPPGGATPPSKTPYEAFLEQPVISALTALGPNAEIRHIKTLDFTATSYRSVQLRQQFAVTAGSQEVDVILTLQRAQLAGDGMSRWLITRFEKGESSQ